MDADEEKRFPRLSLWQFVSTLAKPFVWFAGIHYAGKGITGYSESEIQKSIWRFKKRPETPRSE